MPSDAQLKAKQWLDQAVAWTDKSFAEADQGTVDLSWNRRLTLRLLPDEATALLGVTLPAVEPVADVVLGLTNAPHLFVRVLGAVGGIITKADLQKFDPRWTTRSSAVERSTT